MDINDLVRVKNIENYPNSYKKYLNQIGVIKAINKETECGKTIIIITFINDNSLHKEFYKFNQINNIISAIPLPVKFYDYDLEDINNL